MSKPAVVGYVRVSTDEQATNGNGLAVQRQAIRDWCKSHDLRLVKMTSDAGQSGSNGLDTRLGLSSALLALEDGEVHGLVVYRLDRLARDVVLQETLIRRIQAAGAAIHSTTEENVDSDDPTRVLVRQIVGVIGEYERKLIRARMMAGKAAKVAQGGYGGGRPPFGYRAENGELVPDEHEQETLGRMRALADAGASTRAIADAINAEGRLTKDGATWSSARVWQVLARESAR